MRTLPLLPALRRDATGATLIEFALVLPAFLTLILGGMDAGYGMYLRTVAAGTVEATARAASLEGATESQTERDIRDAIKVLLPNYAKNDDNIVIEKRNYTNFSRIDAAEKMTTDANSNGVLDIGDCWLDEDGNGEFGVNEGADGLGGPDDSVYYEVTVSLPRLFPMHTLLGFEAVQSITVKTLVVNQPFGAQPVRATLCRST